MTYNIHGSTIFIKSNNFINHFIVNKDEVFRSVYIQGDEIMEFFHKLGDTPLNTEAILLNELRKKGEI